MSLALGRRKPHSNRHKRARYEVREEIGMALPYTAYYTEEHEKFLTRVNWSKTTEDPETGAAIPEVTRVRVHPTVRLAPCFKKAVKDKKAGKL